MISPNERKTKIKMICFNSCLKLICLNHSANYLMRFATSFLFKLFRSNNFGRHELWQSSSLFLSHVILSNKANVILSNKANEVLF